MILKSYEYTHKSLIYFIYKDEWAEKTDEGAELCDEGKHRKVASKALHITHIQETPCRKKGARSIR